jgi:hypothetical protein
MSWEEAQKKPEKGRQKRPPQGLDRMGAILAMGLSDQNIQGFSRF